MSAPEEMDPYRAPLATAPELPQDDSRKWRIEGGSLWVQDGAVLPPVCLYGSRGDNHTVRGWVKLVWLSPLAWRVISIGQVVMAGALFVVAMRGLYGALGFMKIVIAASILVGGMQLLFYGWKKHRRRFTIFRVAGRRRFLRGLVFSLAAFGVYAAALSLVVHFEGALKLGQLQRIGLSNTLMFAMIVAQTSGRLFLTPHAAEIEGAWFRLASIHPRAIAELAEIQARDRDQGDDTSA